MVLEETIEYLGIYNAFAKGLGKKSLLFPVEIVS